MIYCGSVRIVAICSRAYSKCRDIGVKPVQPVFWRQYRLLFVRIEVTADSNPYNSGNDMIIRRKTAAPDRPSSGKQAVLC